jgi:hypothetical protein
MRILNANEAQKYETHKKTLETIKKNHKEELRDIREKHRDETRARKVTEKDLREKLSDAEAENVSLKSQHETAVKIKTLELEVNAKSDLVTAREKAVANREKAAEIEDDKKYKSGYEDGVSDGLRKGYDLTADDRHNMALVAMAAAASHSDSEATSKLTSAMIVGLEKDNVSKQLVAGSKKKS